MRDKDGADVIDKTKIKWLFFDVGDTLLSEDDSMFDWCEQIATELRRRGHLCTAEEVVAARARAYAEFSSQLFDRMFEILEVANEKGVTDAAKYQHALERPADGAAEALQLLSPHFKIGIIANQSTGTSDRLCARGWGDHISLCISSTEEGLKKPDLAIFQLALERAGCKPDEAVMIGDRIDNDIRPAKAIGMATIRIRQGLARVQEARETADQPDVTLTSLRELPSLLL